MSSKEFQFVVKAMDERLYDMASIMIDKLPLADKETPEFVARYKVFVLARWLSTDDWSTDEPHVVLSIIADELGDQGSGTFVLQSAAHILKKNVSKTTTLGAFRKMVARVFPPDEDTFEPFVQKLIEVASEMQSPETALISLTKNEDEFRRVMTELLARMEGALAAGGDEVDEAEVDETFTAAELRAAFPGTWDEWTALIRQTSPEVRAFLAQRNGGVPPAPAPRSPAVAAKVTARKGGAAKTVPKPAAKPAAKPASNQVSSPVSSPASSPVSSPAAKPAPKPAAKPAAKPASKPAAVPAAARSKPALTESAVKAPASSAKRRFFSHNEELDLMRGILKYGVGSWSKIHSDGNFNFDRRSASDLKDKWRNLEKQGRVAALKAELGALRQEVPTSAKKRARADKVSKKSKNVDDDEEMLLSSESDAPEDIESSSESASSSSAAASPQLKKKTPGAKR